MSDYSEKLKSPKWQKKRLEVMERDNFKCSCCGCDNVNLQVHHIEYLGGLNPWEYPIDMLLTLCENCHAKEQVRWRHENYMVTTFRLKAFTAEDIIVLSAALHSDDKLVAQFKNLCKKLKNGN